MGVRTRFCNTLFNEVKVASSLIENAQDGKKSEDELKNLISDISICQKKKKKKKIRFYIEKLELLSEKVCDDDEDLITAFLDDDSKICSCANYICDKLKRIKKCLARGAKKVSFTK